MVNEAPAHELLLEDAHLRTFILRAAKRDSPSTAACTLIQNGRLTRPVFAPDVVRVLKLLLPQLESASPAEVSRPLALGLLDFARATAGRREEMSLESSTSGRASRGEGEI